MGCQWVENGEVGNYWFVLFCGDEIAKCQDLCSSELSTILINKGVTSTYQVRLQSTSIGHYKDVQLHMIFETVSSVSPKICHFTKVRINGPWEYNIVHLHLLLAY